MIIKGGTVITPFKALYNSDVVVENGIIKAVKENGTYPEENGSIIDAAGCYVCPGLVDIHTHGGGGGDYMDARPDSFDKALSFQARNGITSVLVSTVVSPIPQILDTLKVVRAYKQFSPYARVLGAHLEGPFLSLKNKGAQRADFLRNPSDGYDFVLDNKDVVLNITISPELPGAEEMTRELVKNNIIVSGGHDDAQYDTIIPVIDAGLTNITHLFCAMSSVAMRDGVRSVGLTEIGLTDDRLSVELIADNHHLPAELVKLAYHCKGPRKACVISDCLRVGGMPEDGRLYSLGSDGDPQAQKFIVAGDVARLPDGSRYAGSIMPVNRMLKNLIRDANIPLCDAVCMASYTPAKIIHKEHEIGSVSVGRKADFCIMNGNLDVIMTIIDGKIVYKKT